MAISYPLTLPAAFHSREISFTADSAVAVVPSPFTFTEQTQVHPGQRFVMTIKLPPMKRATAEDVIGSLLQLNGREGTFYCGDLANKLPRGTATGTPLTNGTQTARSNDLLTKGWTAGVTGILKKGDWIQVGTGSTRRLHKVMADADSDGSGNSTLLVWPKTRSAYAGNLTIVTSSPLGVFKLADVTTWDVDVARIYGITITANEVP